jgi:hypothetical protein
MNIKNILFTIVIIIVLYYLFRYLFKDVSALQNNMVNGQTTTLIKGSTLSTNQNSNNFAYSIWFYVNDFNYRYGEPKVIFGRMGSRSSTENGSVPGLAGLDPCPAVVLGSVENNLDISLGCFPGINQLPTTPGGKTIVHTCSVANVPIQKWVNLTISVYGRSLDVYIDGKLVKTCLLPGVANISNSSDVYITPQGGFDGWTSRFQYYPYSLNPQEVYNIYTKGYGGSNFLQNYQVQVSLVENGMTQSSVTI